MSDGNGQAGDETTRHHHDGQTNRGNDATQQWIARALFRAGSARQVLAVHLPKSRSYMHLDTVITMCDRDLVTMFPPVIAGARTWAIRPGRSARRPGDRGAAGTLPEHVAPRPGATCG
jgi:arginine deiminase